MLKKHISVKYIQVCYQYSIPGVNGFIDKHILSMIAYHSIFIKWE